MKIFANAHEEKEVKHTIPRKSTIDQFIKLPGLYTLKVTKATDTTLACIAGFSIVLHA